MNVAQTILSQLGGNKFLSITGAHSLVGGDDFLRMKLRRNKSRANYLTITLMPDDTYTMRFWYYSEKFNMNTLEIKRTDKTIAEYDGIYFDQLQEIFTEVTGMYTRLF
jgi:hypothetical protein